MKSVNTLGIVNHLHLAVIQTSHLRLIHDIPPSLAENYPKNFGIHKTSLNHCTLLLDVQSQIIIMIF